MHSSDQTLNARQIVRSAAGQSGVAKIPDNSIEPDHGRASRVSRVVFEAKKKKKKKSDVVRFITPHITSPHLPILFHAERRPLP